VTSGGSPDAAYLRVCRFAQVTEAPLCSLGAGGRRFESARPDEARLRAEAEVTRLRLAQGSQAEVADAHVRLEAPIAVVYRSCSALRSERCGPSLRLVIRPRLRRGECADHYCCHDEERDVPSTKGDEPLEEVVTPMGREGRDV